MALKKRSLNLAGHATSVALEPEFWGVLEALAKAEGVGLNGLVARLDAQRGDDGLASACRLFCLRSLMVKSQT